MWSFYLHSSEGWTPKFIEQMEAEHEWMNNEWMLGIIQDPMVYAAMNQENSKGTIFSLLFFLGEQLGDFLGFLSGMRWYKRSLFYFFFKRSLILKMVLWVTAMTIGLLSSMVVKNVGSGVRLPWSESLLCLLATVWSDLRQITEPWYLLHKVPWSLNEITNQRTSYRSLHKL